MCQAPSPTVSLNITEAKFTQPASEEDSYYRHSRSSFHDSTLLSGHAGFTAVFRHCLGNYFGQGPNTLALKAWAHLGSTPWEGPLTGAELVSQPSLCLSSMTSPHLPPPHSPQGPTRSGISVELLVWRRQRQVGEGDKGRTSLTKATPELQSLHWTENSHHSVTQTT